MNKRRRKRRTAFVEADGAVRAITLNADGTVNLPLTLFPDELAKLAGCSRQHVWRACRAGTIKAQQIGSKWLIGRAEAKRVLSLTE
jgi:excisionase family DNA binding protein